MPWGNQYASYFKYAVGKICAQYWTLSYTPVHSYSIPFKFDSFYIFVIPYQDLLYGLKNTENED